MTSKGYIVQRGAIADEVVDGYLNLVNRHIKPQARAFSESAELKLPTDRMPGYHELRRKVEAGEALRPHQSTSMATPDYYDALFLDWGIQHFHLNKDPHPRVAGFVARSGPLLFARVTPTDFYAIQVYEHGAWNKNEIIEILDRNWPKETQEHKLKGIRPITPPHTEQETKGFRTVGLTALAQAGGSFLAPMGGGFRSNSQSSRILENRAHLIEICRELEERALPILQEFAKHNGPLLDKQDVVLERRSAKLFVVEKSTNTDICVVDWPIVADIQ
jgi:hypothetical protein